MKPINSLPTADLSAYLMHGGPRAESLFGGVLSGEFVRGGRLWNILGSKEELANSIGRTIEGQNMPMNASVLQSGTDVSQSQSVLLEYQKRTEILQNAKGHTAEELTAARAFVEKNRDIISGVHSGQVHMTGIKPAISAGNTAYEYGGIHLIKVPENLNPAKRLGELGQGNAAGMSEVPFWGQHKPIASVKTDQFTNSPKVTSDIGSLNQPKIEKYAPLIDEMINDANRNLSPEEKAAYRASQLEFGNEITPAQRAFITDEFKMSGSSAGIAMNAQDEMGFDITGKRAVGGMDDTIDSLQRATNKDEMISIVQSATRKRLLPGARSKGSRKP